MAQWTYSMTYVWLLFAPDTDGPRFHPRYSILGIATPSSAPCLLEFLVMSFGVSGAPASFSMLMNHVVELYLNKFVLVYLDDICIYETLGEYLQHLRTGSFFTVTTQTTHTTQEAQVWY